jgi:2-dehydro-3-deoxygalactonokinase
MSGRAASNVTMIVVDWGTTHLRAYRLAASGEIQACKSAAKGIMSIEPGTFAAVLEKILGNWHEPTGGLILMSGMIGSRQGWFEVPYVECPAGQHELAAGVKRLEWTENRNVFICPGLICCDAEGVPDVMRGEEVQIVGALPNISETNSATILLPGTHSKHALVRNGRIERFLTHMTGEIFALLRDHSILGRLTTERRSDLDAFDAGVHRSQQPSGLLHHVFGVRTRVLMNELDAASLTDYLSGILIGHELISSPPPPPVLIVGDPTLCALYERALSYFKVEAEVMSADVATARGLYAIGELVGRNKRGVA